MKIRPALPGEGACIASMIRDSLPPSVEGLTIWHCAGAARYVEQQLRDRAGARDPLVSAAYWVLDGAAGQPAGMAKLRTAGDSIFLDHIYVAAGARGAARGRELLRRSVTQGAAESGSSFLMLDADPSNELAFGWYQRLGLAQVGETFWQTMPLRPVTAERLRVHGWAAAETQHAELDFSQFRLGHDDGCFLVGRLGGAYFRLTQARACTDRRVHYTLHAIDPKRSLLMITGKKRDHLEVKRRTVRMRAGISDLLRRLE